MPVEAGVHDLRHVSPLVNFGAYAYGMAPYESYAHTGWARERSLAGSCTATATLPGDGLDQDGDGLVDEDLAPGGPGVNLAPEAFDTSASLDEDGGRALVLPAFDANGDLLSFRVETPPAHGTVEVTGAVARYWPDSQYAGPDSFGFVAHDGALDSNEATVTLTVLPLADPPVITSSPVTGATQDALYAPLFVATDPDPGETLTWSLVTGPAGMTLDAGTGEMSWTPTATQVASHAVIVRVEDTTGLSDSQSFTLAVANVNDPPQITSLAPGEGEVGQAYAYDELNRLTGISAPGIAAAYAYDADGNRVEATENGLIARYLVDTNRLFAQVIEERDDLGNLEAHYTWGPRLLRQDRRGVVSYYHADGHTSIRALTDAAGQVTDTYDYDAYGGLFAQTGSSVNDYRYAGEQFVPGLGGYYLRARYYQPGVGRFLTRDEFAGLLSQPLTLSKYLYGNCNPVSFTDPSGNISWNMTTVGVVLTVAGVVWSATDAVVNPSLVSIGLLALDVGTFGTASKMSLIACGIQTVRKTKRLTTFLKAVAGGKKVLDAYKYSLRFVPLGLYDEVVKGIKKAGLAGVYQANHLNQLSAFLDIPRRLGLAIPLKGSAKIAGTQHWRFHKAMDDFWELYRRGGGTPNALAYEAALYNALESAGVHYNDALHIAKAAVDQAKHFGYFGGGKILRIPGRTTAAAI